MRFSGFGSPWNFHVCIWGEWVQLDSEVFFFLFINNFAKELIKILTQYLLNYLHISDQFNFGDTRNHPYTLLLHASSQRGNRYYQNDVIPLQNLFLWLSVIEIERIYRQTKNPNSINHYFSSWHLLTHTLRTHWGFRAGTCKSEL